MDAINSLLSLEASEFIKKSFGKHSLIGRIKEENLNRALFSIKAFSDNVQVASRLGNLQIVKDGDYVAIPAMHNNVNLQSIWKHFYSGYSLIMNSTHLYVQNISDVCHNLALQLNRSIQANIYYTPKDSVAFDLHSDSHDVIVLQISGFKSWEVHDDVLDSSNIVLTQGDSLYIPKGTPHRAKSENSSSLHITIGLKDFCYSDFLSSILAKDKSLNENIAAGIFNTDTVREKLTADLNDYLSKKVISQELVENIVNDAQSKVTYSLCKSVSVFDRNRDISQVIFDSFYPLSDIKIDDSESVSVACGSVGASFNRYEWDVLLYIEEKGVVTLSALESAFPEIDDNFYERISTLNLVNFI